MKSIFLVCALLLATLVKAQNYPFKMPEYTPTTRNVKSRNELQDMKFGLFIHWGIYSVLGDGEWVMHQKKIPYNSYKKLADFFNPQQFNAKEWVQLAKSAGMKYITITSRHHDGFSMFKTAASPYNIVDATPYAKDPLKELAAECKKEGIRLQFYYSLLDWGRPDYGFGNKIVNGAPENTDWPSYINFMKAELTELLTNYGDIGAIWFDGHWERPTANWHYDEIYSLIHKLSPNTLIGNNHHLATIPGEDFQMFEKDLPGANTTGFSQHSVIGKLPLETCETINNNWGFNINDNNYKTPKQIIHYLINAAGRNANFLLNVGPMPNGKIQPEFGDTLKVVGDWMKKYGESIYSTRGNVIDPQDWGVLTVGDKAIYLHLLKKPTQSTIVIPGLDKKVKSVKLLTSNAEIKFKQSKTGLSLVIPTNLVYELDEIIKIQTL